jgi:hypothetical protein
MTERMTVEQARELLAKPKRRKYRNEPTLGSDGRTYASRLEARHAEALEVQKRAGLIRGFLPQVSLPVPGTSKRMIIDFLVVRLDGSLALQDTKGVATREWLLKAELIECALGTPVDLIRRTR